MTQALEDNLNGFGDWLQALSLDIYGENVLVSRAVADDLHVTAPATCAQMIGFGHWLKEAVASELALSPGSGHAQSGATQ